MFILDTELGILKQDPKICTIFFFFFKRGEMENKIHAVNDTLLHSSFPVLYF